MQISLPFMISDPNTFQAIDEEIDNDLELDEDMKEETQYNYATITLSKRCS